jgi:RNA polymerase sigma-70 factor (ECF subfamily)
LVLDDALLEQLANRRLDEQPWLDELNQALANCLQRLPAEQRRLVEQCYDGKASIKEVAARCGRTPNVVYKLLRQIRQALYDCVT